MTERKVTASEQLAVLQEQVSWIKDITSENNRALRGSENYIGMIAQVSTLSTNMETLMNAVQEVRTAIGHNNHPCENCGIEEVTKDVEDLKDRSRDFPSLLYLLRYKTKETVPILVFIIVTVSLLGHIQFEPMFVILASGVGLSPAITAALLKVFGK